MSIKIITSDELKVRALRIENEILVAQLALMQAKHKLTGVVSEILEKAGPEYTKIDDDFNAVKGE